MKRILFVAMAAICGALSINMQAEDLSAYNYARELFQVSDYEPVKDAQPKANVSSLRQAMEALPLMPNVEQILTNEAKHQVEEKVYAPYQKSLEKMMEAGISEQMMVSAKMQQSRQKQAGQHQQVMQQYDASVSAGLAPSQQELMQIVMASGVNMETATEAEMMDVVAVAMAKKWEVPKQDAIKIMDLAQRNPEKAEEYIRKNHPALYQRFYAANLQGAGVADVKDDPNQDKLGELQEQLNALQQEILRANEEYAKSQQTIARAASELEEYLGGSDLIGFDLVGFDMILLQEQLFREWMDSEECKQINAIEAALEERVSQWTSTLQYDVMADVPYPAWWTAERNKENQLVEKWNRRVAPRWLKVATAQYERMQQLFQKAVMFEQENEQLGESSNKENIIYLSNKNLLLGIRSYMLYLTTPIQDALNFPCVKKVDTDGSAHLGKG